MMVLPCVTLRPAMMDDLPGIVEVAADASRSTSEFLRARLDISPAEVGAWCKRELPWVRVAERAKTVIGFLAWRQDEMVGVIGLHFVRPGFRGRGIGGALLSEALRQVREAGLRLFEVTVPEPSSGACRMYRSAGFREVGRLVYTVRRGEGPPVRMVAPDGDAGALDRRRMLGFEPQAVWVCFEKRLGGPA